jgi:hypothetical protein
MAIAQDSHAASNRVARSNWAELLPCRRRICRPRRSRLGRRCGRWGWCSSGGRLGSRWLLGDRLFGGRFLCGGRCARGELDDDRIRPQPCRLSGHGNCFKFFCLGQVAVERESHRRGGINRQRERTRSPAGLSVRRFRLGAGRFGLKAHGVQSRTRFKSVKVHPVGGRRARREGKRATDNRKNSVHHINRPTRANSRRSPAGRIGASSCRRNILRHVNLTKLTIISYHSPSDCRKNGVNRSGQLREMIDDPVWAKFSNGTFAIAKVDRNNGHASRTRGANVGV